MVVYICVVSGLAFCVVRDLVYLFCKWSRIYVLYVVVYLCVVSGRVYICCEWSCMFLLYMFVYICIVIGHV